MARKIKTIVEEKKEIQKRLDEIESLELEAIKEEQETVETVKKSITQICDDNAMFCGVILTTGDILSIVQLAIQTKDDTIKIPFNIYFND